jgi:hypothetical protein
MVESETKKCGTCERDIEVGKFRMHEIGCARMNYKCRVCGEVVAKEDKEDHEAEAHKKEVCQYCKFEAMASEFGTHEETCELKPKKCLYCEQILDFERYLNHIEQCGSRTY